MTRAELLARIRKCLNLARSTNEHEAAAALAKARQLMDEHGVDEVEAATIDVGEAEARGAGAWTPSRWESSLVGTVCRAIPVRAIGRGDSGWTFIGFTPAPEIAAYAFTNLYRQLRRARTEYMRTALRRVRSPRRKTARADAFAEGWAAAVFRLIAALYPPRETDALVIAYFERRFPDRRTIKPRATAAADSVGANDADRGWSAGRNVQLNHGVAGAAAPQALIHG